MTSYEIVKNIDKLIASLENIDFINEMIRNVSQLYPEVREHIYKVFIVDQPETQQNLAANTVEHLKRIGSEIKFVSAGSVFVEIFNLKKDLQENKESIKLLSSFIEDTLIDLDKLYSDYEHFIQDQTTKSTLSVMDSTLSLNESLQNLKKTALSIKTLISNEFDYNTKSGTLSLFFLSSVSYNETINKLTALESIYNEFCRLLNVSTSEHPIELLKLDIGSLWLKIFGESKIITLITSLIESGLSYLHRNFTREGKILSIPKKVEIVEDMLQLSTKLKELGIDSKVLNDNIAQSTIIISQELNKLLINEPVVDVNEKRFSIVENVQEKLLTEKKRFLLETKNEEGNG